MGNLIDHSWIHDCHRHTESVKKEWEKIHKIWKKKCNSDKGDKWRRPDDIFLPSYTPF